MWYAYLQGYGLPHVSQSPGRTLWQLSGIVMVMLGPLHHGMGINCGWGGDICMEYLTRRIFKGMPHCKSLQSIHTLMYKVRGVSWLSSG